ncbi:hemolysin activation/secretion signal peptide protein [Janthinobacterium sp. Marseille]|nr:ShlB/FhaC/HecB family hemolysin secretion/activation protein [Janthinobacterium sp. Marseille]ABR89590.1 hemolysin activation/secretion signal peptide protein [Janthinobacterium sp. Marseille]
MSFDRVYAPSGLVLALCLSSSTVALAQVLPNAGSTLRESQQSAPALPMPATGTIQLPPEPPAPVPTVDSIRFQVQAFRISGNQSIDSALLLPLVQDVTGAERSLGELEQAASRITAYYREHGYLVARAYIPAQDIQGGVVEITVLEGHYDKVRLDNQSGFSDAILQRYLTPQQLGETVNDAELERAILLIQDVTQAAQAGGNLQPGALPGTTDLTLKVGPAPGWQARLEADNYGVRNTGRNRFGGAVQWNNPTGNADRLDARVFTTADGQDYARLGYSIAVGGDGLRLGLAYVESRYQVGGDFAALDAYGRAGVWSATASYPLRRSRDFNLNLEAGLDQKSLQDNVGAFASSTRKSNQVAGLGLSGDVRNRIASSEGTTTFSLRAESGRLDIETPLAREIDALSARTNGAYQRYTYALAQYQWLGNSTMLLLSVNGQQASKNLDSAEKMSLGGPFAVRAYPSGEASGDKGYVATAEIRHTLDQQLLPGQLMLSGFVDSGMVETNAKPFIQGDNQRRLSGAGVGLSFAMQNRLELRLMYAHKIGAATARSDTDRSGRIWGMLAFMF